MIRKLSPMTISHSVNITKVSIKTTTPTNVRCHFGTCILTFCVFHQKDFRLDDMRYQSVGIYKLTLLIISSECSEITEERILIVIRLIPKSDVRHCQCDRDFILFVYEMDNSWRILHFRSLPLSLSPTLFLPFDCSYQLATWSVKRKPLERMGGEFSSVSWQGARQSVIIMWNWIAATAYSHTHTQTQKKHRQSPFYQYLWRQMYMESTCISSSDLIPWRNVTQ